MSRSRTTDSGAAGFTLIEALVALAIVGFVLASLSALISTTMRGSRAIESHLQRLEIARAIVTALPNRDQLAPGEYWGEKSGARWRMDVSPFEDTGIIGAQSDWIPETVTVTVQPAVGPAMQIDTIRLRHRVAQ